MADHYHAVVWIDHQRARILHFNVEEADRTLIRDHVVRDIHAHEKRTGHRIEENKPFFEDVAKTIADAGAILIVGPAQEKDFFAKFLGEKHPAIRAHIEGWRKRIIRPTANSSTSRAAMSKPPTTCGRRSIRAKLASRSAGVGHSAFQRRRRAHSQMKVLHAL